MRYQLLAAILAAFIACIGSLPARADTLVEHFNAGIPPERWNIINVGATDAPWNVFAPDVAGGLRISKPADNDPTTPWIFAGVESRFLLDGNFTTSVGFNLLAFPLADSDGWNKAIISVVSQTTGEFFMCLRLSDFRNQGAEGWSSVPPHQIGNRTDFTTIGRLGVSRSGSTMSAWIDRGNGPVVLGSNTSSLFLGPMSVAIRGLQGAYEGIRPHNALDIRYDDFQALADTIIMPTHPLGDLNCDDLVDFFDIDPFVLALTSHSQYVQTYPNCDRDLADCNGDGYIDFFDIDAFVALLGT